MTIVSHQDKRCFYLWDGVELFYLWAGACVLESNVCLGNCLWQTYCIACEGLFFDTEKIPWIEPVHHISMHGTCPYLPEAEANEKYYASLSDREKHFLHAVDAKFPLTPSGPEETCDIGQNLLRVNLMHDRSSCVTPGAKIWLRRRRMRFGT